VKENEGHPPLREQDLRNWKMVEHFQECLESAFGREALHPSFSDPKRLLEARQYLSLFLFGLFNPAVKTMRGLCEISRLQRVKQEVCARQVSLGSFSEAQHLLEPGLLERAFEDLSARLPRDPGEGRLGQWQWLARDGSLFRALPRMHWALYGGGRAGYPNRAVRLHLSLNILEDKPEVAAVRAGKVCERKVWRQQWRRGQAYVGDCYFGEDYHNFALLSLKECVYVLRLREQSVIHVEEELPLSPADRAAGVWRQAWAHLGSTHSNRSVRVRVVWVRADEGSTLLLVTNLSPEVLPAELVSLVYRKRWKIEVFFRWIKCILGCRHWLAESAAGVTLQIYLALIAALLLQLYLGRRPNKRMMELVQMHQQGWATDQELIEGLARHKAKMDARKKG
jgi:hypothetical protein